MVRSEDARLQAGKSLGMGLQVSSGLDDEISLSGTGRGCRAAVSGVAAGDSDEQGDEDPCGINQP